MSAVLTCAGSSLDGFFICLASGGRAATHGSRIRDGRSPLLALPPYSDRPGDGARARA